jgi:hypothetical protein
MPRNLLLVEGRDDQAVLTALWACRHQETLTFGDNRPVEDLLRKLPTFFKVSDVKALGVVVDADSDLAARWRSLSDKLRAAGYQNIPTSPSPDGTIVTRPKTPLLALVPRVGVWIWPNNQSDGILEDFVRSLVPVDCPLLSRAESAVAEIPSAQRRFVDVATPKAVIHTWLAWQKDPGTPFGTAIKAKFLDGHVADAEVLVKWLRELFFP